MSRLLYIISVVAIPNFVWAATIPGIIQDVIEGGRRIIGLIFVAATVIALWGFVQLMQKAGDVTGQKQAKQTITWGLIGLTVMAASWGIVTILINYFQVGGIGIPQPIP